MIKPVATPLLFTSVLLSCLLLHSRTFSAEPDAEATDAASPSVTVADVQADVPTSPEAALKDSDVVENNEMVQPNVAAEQAASAGTAAPVNDLLAAIKERPEEPPPFDFAPYRVLIWIAADDPRITAASLEDELVDFLDRDFHAVWRTVIADAPPAVASVARRDLASITFDTIAASDPVIALKKGHEDSLRINFASDAGRFLKEIPGTQGRVQDIIARIARDPESKTTPAKFQWTEKLRAIDGDAIDLKNMWLEATTEAILCSRGMAETLDDPKAKLIVPPLKGQVVHAIEQFDKIYIARLQTQVTPATVEVIELDTLMRHFGDVATRSVVSKDHVGVTVASAVRETFSPVVRIDNAGQKDAVGLVRAAGLVLDPESPALIRVGDVLEPLVRKENRNGDPLTIGPLDWAYLLVVENELAAFGALDAPGIQPGDRIVSMAGKTIDSPHLVAQLLREIPTVAGYEIEPRIAGTPPSMTISYSIEVMRNGKPEKLTISAGDTPALQPQYFGVHVREKTIDGKQRAIVTEVLEESPAVNLLKIDDVILAVGKSKDINAQTLLQTVVTTSESASVEFTIGRGDQTETVSITPSPISNRNQRASSSVHMDFYAGRMGGLQGRKNNRTHRMAMRIKPRLDNTMLQLHAKGKPDDPLIGYEIYGKELDSTSMTFVGRTDWSGRLLIEKIDRPLRLLYVKNGGAVLARLPMVPGHHPIAVADLEGDDMRLQAEAYIRGVQNAIVDLTAVRQLFNRRIMMRIEAGNMRDAEEMLEKLRSEPSNEKIANDMGKKQTMFLKAIGRNQNQRRKVDEMFSSTREMLSKQINPKIINDLEAAMIAAQAGQKIPPAPESPAEAAPEAEATPPAEEQPAEDTSGDQAPLEQ